MGLRTYAVGSVTGSLSGGVTSCAHHLTALPPARPLPGETTPKP